jgi:hypothetical protein
VANPQPHHWSVVELVSEAEEARSQDVAKVLGYPQIFNLMRFKAFLISTLVKRETTSKPKLVSDEVTSHLLLQRSLPLRHRNCDECHITTLYESFMKDKIS